MRLFVTGGTGLVGRRLVADRLARGDEVVVLSRERRRAVDRLGAADGLHIVEGDPTVPGPWQREIDGSDAIVHLAGAGVADRRWTPSYKRQIAESRIDSGHQLIEAMRAADQPPRVLVTASAIGIYPAAGDAELAEDGPINRGDFLGDVCVAWEAASAPARAMGTRVVALRFGIVLDPEGGLVGKLAPIFRAFLGGPIGFGRAWTSWIHWADAVGLVDHALRTESVDGPMNATSPGSVRNGPFSRALGAALGRPSLFPVPTPMLRVVAGEFGRYAAASQRVVPRVAESSGYEFVHRDVTPAMASLFTAEAGGREPGLGPQPVSALAVPPPVESEPEPGAPVAGPEHPIRLVALAYEGGLHDPAGRVSAGAVAACRVAASSAGIVVATGRPPRAIDPFVRSLGTGGISITCNGALVWDHEQSAARHHEPLEAEVAAEVATAVRAAGPGTLVAVERLNRWFTDRAPDDAAIAEAIGEPDGVGPLESLFAEPVTQLDLLVPADELDAVRAALDRLVADGRIARFERSGGLLQVTHPRAEKAIALQRIARAAGIEREAVLALGAGLHDSGMVEWAGYGVALAGAPSLVRRIADAVVESRSDGGVARALTRFVMAGDRPVAGG